MKKIDEKTSAQLQAMMIHKAKTEAVAKERAAEIFDKLLQIPEFMQWMKDHIVIRDEVDHDSKTITTYVIYADNKEEMEAVPPEELSKEN